MRCGEAALKKGWLGWLRAPCKGAAWAGGFSEAVGAECQLSMASHTVESVVPGKDGYRAAAPCSSTPVRTGPGQTGSRGCTVCKRLRSLRQWRAGAGWGRAGSNGPTGSS